MFRRWLLTSTALLVAACVFLTPRVATAQVFIGGGNLLGRPSYISPYSGPANRVLYNPYGSGPFGGDYFAGIGGYGNYGGYTGYGSFASPYGLPSGYIPQTYSPGLYNYSTAFTPVTSGGALAPASTSPSTTIGIPVTYGAPLYYTRPVTYVGYPNYVYQSGSITPLPTYYAQYSYNGGPTYANYPGVYNAYGVGPTTFEANSLGGLNPSRPAQGTLNSGTQVARLRPGLFPAVAVPASESLLREAANGTEANGRAHIEVILPSGNAEVFFQGTKTTQTGTVREFVSPPLGQGLYTYQVRARWTANGEPVTMSRKVQVRAGEQVRVDFTSK